MTNKNEKIVVGPGDTLETITGQINTNTSNMNIQIVQTDTNTTDILELKQYLNVVGDGIPVTQEQLGDLNNLTTDDKTNVVSAINEIDANTDANYTDLDGKITALTTRVGDDEVLINDNKINITTNTDNIGDLAALTTDSKINLVSAINELDLNTDANTAKNNNQDLRLNELETALAGTVSDYTVFNGPRTIGQNLTSTAINVQPLIVRDFLVDANQIATWNNIGTIDQSITVNKKATIEGDFYFDVNQVTGTVVDLTVELYSKTNLDLLDSVTRRLDFSGSISIAGVEGAFIADADANEEFIIRAYVDGTNVVDITNYGGKLKVNSVTGELTSVFDYNVISTSEVGGSTTLEDLNILNARTASPATFLDGYKVAEVNWDDKADHIIDNGETGLKTTAGDKIVSVTAAGTMQFGSDYSAGEFLLSNALGNIRMTNGQGAGTGVHFGGNSHDRNYKFAVVNDGPKFRPNMGVDDWILLEDYFAEKAETFFLSGEAVNAVDLSTFASSGDLTIITDRLTAVETEQAADNLIYTRKTNGQPRVQNAAGNNVIEYLDDGVKIGSITDSGELEIYTSNVDIKTFSNGTDIAGNITNFLEIGYLDSKLHVTGLHGIQVSTPTGSNNKQIVNIEYFNNNAATKESILDALHPIGSILIQSTAPTIGTWEDLGLLSDGQGIVGGSTTNGAVASHNHSASFTGNALPEHVHQSHSSARTYAPTGGGSQSVLKGIAVYNSDGTTKWIGDSAGTTTSGTGYTKGAAAGTPSGTVTVNSSGTDDKNRAWGLGLGSGVHIWKRTA